MEVKQMADKKVLLVTEIKRQKGKLYFCGTDAATGNVSVVVTNMAKREPKEKKE